SGRRARAPRGRARRARASPGTPPWRRRCLAPRARGRVPLARVQSIDRHRVVAVAQRLLRGRGICPRPVAPHPTRGDGPERRPGGAPRAARGGQSGAGPIREPTRDHAREPRVGVGRRERDRRGPPRVLQPRAPHLRRGVRAPDDRRGGGAHHRDVPPRGVRRARAARRGAEPPRAVRAGAGAPAPALRVARDALHLGAEQVVAAGAAPVRPAGRHVGGGGALAGRDPHARGAEPGGGGAPGAGRGAARGGVRVLREERPRGDDAAHGDRGAAGGRDARGDGRAHGRGGLLAVPGVRRLDRQHRGAGPRQGHARGAARRPRRLHAPDDHARRPRGPGLARGGGGARRLQAPQGAHGDRAGRVRRDGGAGHDGRPARRDRGRDPGRVRRAGGAPVDDERRRDADPGHHAHRRAERRVRAHGARRGLHDDRRLRVRLAGTAPARRRPRRGRGRELHGAGDGGAPGGDARPRPARPGRRRGGGEGL
ncbi:MAG: Magnesium and cobalt efflux protein CorC, partial [uncultured Gemmatimonadaceae bacterium]